jgi:hypothetical protein
MYVIKFENKQKSGILPPNLYLILSSENPIKCKPFLTLWLPYHGGEVLATSLSAQFCILNEEGWGGGSGWKIAKQSEKYEGLGERR